MIFKMWDFSFGTYMVWVSKTQTWKFFGHDFQDVGSSVFGDLEFALRVSKTQKDLGNFRIWFSGNGFQDLGSQLWGLDFHTRGFQDQNLKTFRMWFSRCGISILTHDFQDMDGEPGDFIVSEGHGHPLVKIMTGSVQCPPSSIAFHLFWNPTKKNTKIIWLLIKIAKFSMKPNFHNEETNPWGTNAAQPFWDWTILWGNTTLS